MVRSTRVLAATLALTFLPFAFCSSAAAQSKKNAEFIPGTVVSVEKVEKDRTGRTYKMKFKASADEEELDVTILPKTQLLVTAKGDVGFLRPSVFVMTKVIMTNNEYFAKDFTVVLGGNPQGFVKPDPAEKTVFEIAGKVTMTDTKGMTVQCGPQAMKVSYEATQAVTVKIADPSLIKEGDAAEVEGPVVKAKKTMNAVAVNVTSTTDLTGDAYFASLEERKKTKTTKPKTTTSKSKTKTDDEAAGAAGKESSDPFGVLKKKGTKATKEEKADAAAAKKEEAKKEAEKKDDAKKDDAEKKDTAEKKDAEKTDKP